MDIQVVYMMDVLPVDQVAEIPGVVPRTLDIRGPDFRSVIAVELNEVNVQSFVIVSKNRILAQVPTDQEREIIRSVSVLSSNFTKTSSSKLLLEFTLNPKKVSGLKKLIQTFVLHLLKTPGSDAWYPRSGGGVTKIIGGNFSKDKVGGVAAEFTTCVHRTRSQIISLQATNTRLAPSERLAAANVLSAVFHAELSALLTRVEVVSQSGERALVGLEL